MKGNLFLGFGRKSVGDVVFYKRKGSNEQMARARNRNPHNPKTDKQLYQRAIMATVLQAYSAGKAIFDHSFEGKSVPDGSMNRFMSLNLRRLRAAIAADLDSSTTNATPGRAVAPGATTPVPFAYRISEGSYPNQLLTFDNTTPGALGFKFPTPGEADTTPALYLSNHGFVPGDIYTIVAFGNDPDNTIGVYPDGNLYGCFFGWVRLQVRTDAPSSGALTLDNLFIVTSSNGIDDTIQAGSIIAISDIFDNVNFATGSIGAIRSRYDSGVRSTSDMVMIGTSEFGIASPDILDAWRAGTQQVGDPELLLEGGGSSQPRPAGEPIAPSGNLQVFKDSHCTAYADGTEATVYLRFNAAVGLSDPTSLNVGLVGQYDQQSGHTGTCAVHNTGTTLYCKLWGDMWTTPQFGGVTEGLVVAANNPAGTAQTNPSVIMNWGD